jgi:pilus assembly protein Flp/PilA
MIGFLKTLVQDEAGATAVEYGLIASLISIAAIAGFEAMGASFSSMFETVSSEIKIAVQQSGGSS